MQALCTEASLQALRRSYPQIYDTEDKLLINPAQVVVGKPDFLAAHAGIVPAAHRQAASHARWGVPSFTMQSLVMLIGVAHVCTRGKSASPWWGPCCYDRLLPSSADKPHAHAHAITRIDVSSHLSISIPGPGCQKLGFIAI